MKNYYNKKTNKVEKIVLFIVSVVLMFFLGYAYYSVYKSENSLDINEMPNTSSSTTNYTPSVNSIDIYGDTYIPQATVKTPTETQLSTYTTHIYDKDANRVHNITLAVSKLNGVIIQAGNEFSFNNTIGPMGAAQGFKQAVGFDSHGRNFPSFGGGICQISSTMYNTAMLANLEITERHPHSKRVYYVPVNKDATIYYGSLDFKFINNSGKDIKVLATNNNTDVTITFMSIT